MLNYKTIPIEAALQEDLPAILALQKLAYQSEAALNNDYGIPPLTQTLEEMRTEFGQRLFLKAAVGDMLIGSIRAHLDEANTCHIGRIIVHPDHQNRGLGTRLLQAIEERFSHAGRYELFTSTNSHRNLYLYQKLGYKQTRQKKLNETTTLIFLTKEGTV
ncbi:MAG: GNAT family N-acetyltransferase [Anaerolineales bacterium]|nr:GNAT family N-acetyltransferase [Anaerolineales bacterium]